MIGYCRLHLLYSYSCENCDTVYALISRLSKREKLQQIVCGIGREDSSRIEKRIFQAFLFPAVVVEGVPQTHVSHLRYQARFASSPLTREVRESLQGIKQLVWSDGFVTIPFQTPGLAHSHFPDRSKGSSHIREVMENALLFAITTESCFIDNNPALDFITTSLNVEADAINLLDDEQLKHAFEEMQVIQYRELLLKVAKRLHFAHELRQFIVHICRIKSPAVKPALRSILLDILEREDFLERSDDCAYDFVIDALAVREHPNSIEMNFIVGSTDETSYQIQGFPLGLHLQRILNEGSFIHSHPERVEELKSLGWLFDSNTKDPNWSYLSGGDSTSSLLAVTIMIINTIQHSKVELRELVTSIALKLSKVNPSTRLGLLLCATIMNVIGQSPDHMLDSEDTKLLDDLLNLASVIFKEETEAQFYFMSSLFSFYGGKRVINVEILSQIAHFMINNRSGIVDPLFLYCFQSFCEKFPKDRITFFQKVNFAKNVPGWECTFCRFLRLPEKSNGNDLSHRIAKPKILGGIQLLETLLQNSNQYSFEPSFVKTILESILSILQPDRLDDISVVRRLCLMWLRFANSLTEDESRVEWQKRLLFSYPAELLESDWTVANFLALVTSLQRVSSFRDVPSSIAKVCCDEIEKDSQSAVIVFLGFNSLANMILKEILAKGIFGSFLFVSQDNLVDMKVKSLMEIFPAASIELSSSPLEAVNLADVVIVLQPLDESLRAEEIRSNRNKLNGLTWIDIHDKNSVTLDGDGLEEDFHIVKIDGLDCVYGVLKGFGIVLTKFQLNRVLGALCHGVKHPQLEYRTSLLQFSCSIMKYLLNEIHEYDSATRSGIFSLLCECAHVSKYLQEILAEMRLKPFVAPEVSDSFSSLLDPLMTANQLINEDFSQKDQIQEIDEPLRTIDLRGFQVAKESVDHELARNHPSHGDEVDEDITREEEKIESSRDVDMILTRTTRENVAVILSLTRTGTPIITEGATGAGKSATFNLAASISGNRLVRFNMSQSTSIDDLIGQIQMVGNQFKFRKQPFTEAFENGWWLLLDEINLAKDIVLQCIEEALDTKILTLRDYSSVENASKAITIKMGDGFRLFATQNPNTGFYKGITGAFLLVLYLIVPCFL